MKREPCLFFAGDGSSMLLFYVDDFMVSSENPGVKDAFFRVFGQEYDVKRLGTGMLRGSNPRF